MTNILKVAFNGAKAITSRPLYQYDYGQVLKFIDLNLPVTYEVHFANRPFGDAIIQIGNSGGVLIPDSCLESGLTVYAWVYLHTGADDGETVYQVTIPIIKRAQPSSEEVTSTQQSTIEQALAALEVNVTNSAESASACSTAVTDTQAARDKTRTYMEITEGYKNTAQSILQQIQNSADLGYITIGSTQLTEQDLIKLLSLLEN